MEISDDDLCRHAVQATEKTRQAAQTRKGWDLMGYVGAALVTDQGNLFTGVNLELYCGIGFCAEHSAVAAMVKDGESRIEKIVAATAEGNILPPCGRCREMMFQVDEHNLDTLVIVGARDSLPLRELLPYNWQQHVGIDLS